MTKKREGQEEDFTIKTRTNITVVNSKSKIKSNLSSTAYSFLQLQIINE